MTAGRVSRILTAQWTDADNHNAQVLNARAMLARFTSPHASWLAMAYNRPDPRLTAAPRVSIARLWRRHLWYLHKLALYQSRVDAIFYPGPYWFDEWGLRLRVAVGRRIPVIATVEGLVGDPEREELLSRWAGHRVYCQRVPGNRLRRIDTILRDADRIIAISPFLGDMARRLYGDKVSVVPLGIDLRPAAETSKVGSRRLRVVGAGRIYENKRPELFLDLAERFPTADFVWFGEGPRRAALQGEASRRGLNNVEFAGAVPHEQLQSEMAASSLFILPSLSEGVPKVSMEAAAAGIPVILYGHYHAPSVVDGINGYVVWDDAQLIGRVSELLDDPRRADELGQRGLQMAQDWSWDHIAPLWEQEILNAVRRSAPLESKGRTTQQRTPEI